MPVSLPEVEQPQVDDVVTALSNGQPTVAAVRASRDFPVAAAALASLPEIVALSNVSEMIQKHTSPMVNYSAPLYTLCSSNSHRSYSAQHQLCCSNTILLKL